MSKQKIPLAVADVSAFARALTQQLRQTDETPGHLKLMNMLARAAGFSNFQHLRAAQAAGVRLANPSPPESVDHKRVEKALQQFDPTGCLVRWPSKRSVQDLCLWPLWTTIPKGTKMREKQVNRILSDGHSFGDAAILRRMMVTLGMMTRNNDGSDYQRVEQAPPPEAKALIRLVNARRS